MKASVLSPTLNKMQGQAANQDKIFAKHVSDKWLYEELQFGKRQEVNFQNISITEQSTRIDT